MRKIVAVCTLVIICSSPDWGIYGPSLSRADATIAVRACQESEFAHNDMVVQAMRSGKPEEAAGVLAEALREWRGTPKTSQSYSARAFCLHELVPSDLPPMAGVGSPDAVRPTALVLAFGQIGIQYFYYDPDAQWVLKKDPVDLNELATQHLDSRWGREAFLMMTAIGWSQGSCEEGPDQFRQVIKHAEAFLQNYPQSEVSEDIRLELANAYATWWNLSRTAPNPPDFNPEPYKPGADTAKKKAIELYREYLGRQKDADVAKRLRALQNGPKGSNRYDYFCADYED